MKEVTLSIEDVRHAGSVPAAIVAACNSSDELSSGPIGPEFSTSPGPGQGWSKEHDVGDYADRALADEYGALGYVDEADGRMATLYDDEVEWTAESVVCLIAPSDEDALSCPEALGMMVRALTIHSARTDIAAWTALQERIRRAAEEVSA